MQERLTLPVGDHEKEEKCHLSRTLLIQRFTVILIGLWFGIQIDTKFYVRLYRYPLDENCYIM